MNYEKPTTHPPRRAALLALALLSAAGVLAAPPSKTLAGGSHTLLLKQDGSVWVAGSNGAGQIGLGPGMREALAFVPLAPPRP